MKQDHGIGIFIKFVHIYQNSHSMEHKQMSSTDLAAFLFFNKEDLPGSLAGPASKRSSEEVLEFARNKCVGKVPF